MQSYSGSDTLEFMERKLTDFADGDVIVVTYPNELSSVKTGKNGNTIAVHNEMGRQADVSIRLIKGSPDDKFLNSFVTAWKNGKENFSPATAVFTKIINVDGGVTNEVTSLSFGIPSKNIDTKNNVEGDTEQAISVYSFRFGDSNRLLA